MIPINIIFVIATLFLEITYAFESYPEYSGPTSFDILNFDNPDVIDAEYQSDFLTYLKPVQWQRHLEPKLSFMDVSVGSLSSKRFMVRNRLQLVKDLHSQIVFKTLYIDESDLEDEQQHFLFEFQFWNKSKRWGAAVEGEVSTRKAEDDIGFALLYQPNSQDQWRLYQRFLDFSRNKRNEETDFFRRSPTVTGLVFRRTSSAAEFVQASFRVEPALRWYFPDTNQQYGFEAYMASFLKQWSNKSLEYWSFRAQVKTKKKDQSLTDEYQKTNKILFQLQKEFPSWIFGYHFALRDYNTKTNKQKKVHHLPYVFYKFGRDINHWRVGLESTFFDDSGNLNQRQRTDQDYRLNADYHLKFSDKSELVLGLGFDLDSLGDETWEGGNMKFRTLF